MKRLINQNPPHIPIHPQEIHLWCIDDEAVQDPALLAFYQTLLNPEERAAQRRFHFDKHRHQYLITRVLLRWVLSCYADKVHPTEWIFKKTARGKPYVHAPTCPLFFNLSHTEKQIVLALTLDADIGVDIENTGRSGNFLDVAERMFSPREVHDLRQLALPEQEQRFFELWTLKEAYLKACGQGLFVPLEQFTFLFPTPTSIQVEFDSTLNDCAKEWQFWLLEPDLVYKLSIAIHSPTRFVYPLLVREMIPGNVFYDKKVQLLRH